MMMIPTNNSNLQPRGRSYRQRWWWWWSPPFSVVRMAVVVVVMMTTNIAPQSLDFVGIVEAFSSSSSIPQNHHHHHHLIAERRRRRGISPISQHRHQQQQGIIIRNNSILGNSSPTQRVLNNNQRSCSSVLFMMMSTKIIISQTEYDDDHDENDQGRKGSRRRRRRNATFQEDEEESIMETIKNNDIITGKVMIDDDFNTSIRRMRIFPSTSSAISSNSSSSTLRIMMTTIMMVLIITLGWWSTNANAIDLYPVDFGHLNIPNPLPTTGIDIRYFISGGVCAAASHGITTPIDVVKTRIQSEPELLLSFNGVNDDNDGSSNSNGGGGDGGGGLQLVEAAKTIIQQDGPQTLLDGLVPTIVGYGFEGALKFGLYESLKPTFVQLLGTILLSQSPTTEGYLAASVAAGAVASIVLCPMERIRIRKVTDPQNACNDDDESFISSFARLIQEDGIGSIFFGLPAMLSKQVPYTMAKQVSFDLFAGFFYAMAIQNSIAEADVRTQVEFFAALFASILACLASHPGDVVLTETYKTTGGNDEDGTCSTAGSSGGGFLNVVSNIYNQKGFDGFFTGITARFFHVGAIITSQLILYDIIKQLLGLPATGSH